MRELSVVVSTYNQDKYIRQCLDAILLATENIDAEIIVGDDASTDSTPKILGEYQRQYPGRIHVYYAERNLGANKNYLRIHSLSNGHYVAHVDGDDIPGVDKFSRQLQAMKANKGCTVSFHAAKYFSDDGSVNLESGLFNTPGSITPVNLKQIATWGPIAVHSSYMYKRGHNRLPSILPPFMEWRTSMNCLLRGRGIYIDQILVRYRVANVGSMTGTSMGKRSAYETQFLDIAWFFSRYQFIRRYLYAQAFINAIVQLCKCKELPASRLQFLIANTSNFSISPIISAYRTRCRMAPRVIRRAID